MPAATRSKKAARPSAPKNTGKPDPAPALGAMVTADSKVSKEVRRDLQKIAHDLWWSWNEVAQRPFAALDPNIWEASNHDPMAVLRGVDEPIFAALRRRGLPRTGEERA